MADAAMQQSRKTLTLKRASVNAGEASTDASAELIRRAIGRKTCVIAVYNRANVELAPHILYTKHGELYVDGIVIHREGKPPREEKVRSFKLAGLTAMAPSDRTFAVDALFEPADPKYADNIVSMVEG